MAGGIHTASLENIQIAAPCSAKWGDMSGDERIRHCAMCRKNVYNISEMSRQDAEALIKQKEGHLCVRFYQRADGTVLTANCPVGLRAIRRRLMWIGSGIAAMLVFGITIIRPRVSAAGGFRSLPGISKIENVQPFKTVIDAVDPRPIRGQMVMGKPCATPVSPRPVAPPPVATTQK